MEEGRGGWTLWPRFSCSGHGISFVWVADEEEGPKGMKYHGRNCSE